MRTAITVAETSLAWLTLGEADPLELIRATQAAGFGGVGIKVVPNAGSKMPMVAGNKPLISSIKSELGGLSVLDMGGIWVTPEFDDSKHDVALETGCELGARFVVAAGSDPSPNRLVENIGRLAERAQRVGLKVAVEFIPFSTVPNLQSALTLTSAIGGHSCGILVDILHLSRSGGSPSDVAATPAAAIFVAHLCDAPVVAPSDLRNESRSDRLLPGRGGLPLLDFLDVLPDDTPIEVEAPVSALLRNIPKTDVARLAACDTAWVYAEYERSEKVLRRK